MINKLNVSRIVLVIIIAIGGGIYFFNQNLLGFWISEGIIEKQLSDEVMITEFHIDKEAKHPHAMNLVMKGHIDGTGRLLLGWSDSKFYKTDTVSNDFRVDYNSDWYNDSCFVVFEPIDMTSGNLKIDYKIYSSKK